MLRLSDWVAVNEPREVEEAVAGRMEPEMVESRAVCLGCGPVSTCDEDRCCATCGRDLVVVADAGSADVLTDAIADTQSRAEAAEARAAQVEADAQLVAGLAFSAFVERTSFSPEIVEASLLDALEAAGDHTAAVSDADLIAAVRRILAAAGAA